MLSAGVHRIRVGACDAVTWMGGRGARGRRRRASAAVHWKTRGQGERGPRTCCVHVARHSARSRDSRHTRLDQRRRLGAGSCGAGGGSRELVLRPCALTAATIVATHRCNYGVAAPEANLGALYHELRHRAAGQARTRPHGRHSGRVELETRPTLTRRGRVGAYDSPVVENGVHLRWSRTDCYFGTGDVAVAEVAAQRQARLLAIVGSDMDEIIPSLTRKLMLHASRARFSRSYCSRALRPSVLRRAGSAQLKRHR